MPRNKEPISLIVAKGRAHKTKEEIERRKKTEPRCEDTAIVCPDYLNAKEQESFVCLAEMLKGIGIWSELDASVLGHYIVAESMYECYTKMIYSRDEQEGNEWTLDEMIKLQSLQDRAFKQAHACASSLGLTATSRCKLIIPATEEDLPDL